MGKRTILFIVKLGLSAVLIWYLASGIDLAGAWARVRQMAPDMLLLATALLLLQGALGAVRWWLTLRAVGGVLPWPRILGFYFIGLFFNQVLPSSVGGDPVRMYRAYRAGLPLDKAINGVMLERVSLVLALVLMVTALQPALAARLGGHAVLWVFPLLSLAGVAGVVVMMLLDRMPPALRRWRLVRGLGHLAADGRRVFLRPGNAAAVLLSGALSHANLSIAVWVMARGMDIAVSPMDCLVLVPPVILATTLPISIAGWGVREGAMVTALGFVGVPAEGALVLSVLLGLLAVATSLPGGVVFLLTGERTRAEEVERLMQRERP
ncbi:MAG: flippase-like domain-containing protein [Hyphomicrobiales bacterium]|nr:flippase-like domain-containing protein [Hyphomicrobiales bacterium]MCP5372542.1 flippase-like domain-containing protein [Hyphomicrobiales bacterium]